MLKINPLETPSGAKNLSTKKANSYSPSYLAKNEKNDSVSFTGKKEKAARAGILGVIIASLLTLTSCPNQKRDEVSVAAPLYSSSSIADDVIVSEITKPEETAEIIDDNDTESSDVTEEIQSSDDETNGAQTPVLNEDETTENSAIIDTDPTDEPEDKTPVTDMTETTGGLEEMTTDKTETAGELEEITTDKTDTTSVEEDKKDTTETKTVKNPDGTTTYITTETVKDENGADSAIETKETIQGEGMVVYASTSKDGVLQSEAKYEDGYTTKTTFTYNEDGSVVENSTVTHGPISDPYYEYEGVYTSFEKHKEKTTYPDGKTVTKEWETEDGATTGGNSLKTTITEGDKTTVINEFKGGVFNCWDQTNKNTTVTIGGKLVEETEEKINNDYINPQTTSTTVKKEYKDNKTFITTTKTETKDRIDEDGNKLPSETKETELKEIIEDYQTIYSTKVEDGKLLHALNVIGEEDGKYIVVETKYRYEEDGSVSSKSTKYSMTKGEEGGLCTLIEENCKEKAVILP